MAGIQAIIGRIAQIEERLQNLQAPSAGGDVADPTRPDTSFAAVLASVSRDGRPGDRAATARTSGAAASALTTHPSSLYDSLIRGAAAKHGLDPALVRAVIQVESDYDPRCRSHAGAMGLMQLMPQTCRDYGISDPYDPAQSIEGGCRELAEHLREFGGNVELALAAYNAGPNAVRRHGGIPPYRETQAYVPRVLRLWRGGEKR
jgi:soluble lytic murein transglycosylase-like protein